MFKVPLGNIRGKLVGLKEVVHLSNSAATRQQILVGDYFGLPLQDNISIDARKSWVILFVIHNNI